MQPKARTSAYVVYYLGCLFLSLLIFSPWLHNYFSADDWPVLARNLQISWAEIPSWFTHLRFGWYRPFYELFVALCWQGFGLQPLGYRLLSVALYAGVTAHSGLILYGLVGNRAMALLAAILFCVWAPHAEPVLWFAASNELLAAFFATTSFLAYLRFRTTGKNVWLGVALLAIALALMSKETAAFFPFVFLAYDLVLGRGRTPGAFRWQTLLPALLMSAAGCIFILARFGQGSPYAVTPTATRLLLNLLFYGLTSLLALPSNYAYLASLPLWRIAPLLPATALLCSLSALGVTWWIWWQRGASSVRQKYYPILAFSLLWIGMALLPVSLIVAERTSFLASIGVVMLLAVLFVAAWEWAQLHRPRAARALPLLVLLYGGVNLLTLEYRASWWGQAAAVNQTLATELATRLPTYPAQQPIRLVNLPDHLEYAYALRNAFPAFATVQGYTQPITALLDSELAPLAIEQQQGQVASLAAGETTVIFWYKEGVLQGESSR